MTQLKIPDAIIFDWDGTLVDTLQVLTKGYNDVFVHFGMPTWTLEQGREKIRTSSRETFPLLFGDRADEALKTYYDSIDKHHLVHLQKKIHSEELLRELKNKNIALGLISNKRDVYLKKEVTHLGWDHYFSAIVGAGRAPHDKPSPDLMTVALNEMSLPIGSLELWYVGDTEIDMQFAGLAEAKKIFISDGFGTLEDAEKYDLDLVVKDCESLGKELDTLFNLR